MRKSTLFISAALTTFILAILFGVVSAYQKTAASTPPTPQPTLETVQAVAEPTPVTVEQAAALAAQFMNKQDLYSAEKSSYNNLPAYLITFSSGDKVYIGMDGQVLASVAPQQVAFVSETNTTFQDTQKAPAKKNKNPEASNNSEHEDHDNEDHD